jgi:hypothetical protein
MLNPTSPWSSSSASSAAALELLRPLSSRRDSPPPAPVRMELCTGRRRAIPGAYCPPLPPPRALPGMGKLRGTVTRCQHRRGAMLSRARGASLVVEEVATRAQASSTGSVARAQSSSTALAVGRFTTHACKGGASSWAPGGRCRGTPRCSSQQRTT